VASNWLDALAIPLAFLGHPYGLGDVDTVSSLPSRRSWTVLMEEENGILDVDNALGPLSHLTCSRSVSACVNLSVMRSALSLKIHFALGPPVDNALGSSVGNALSPLTRPPPWGGAIGYVSSNKWANTSTVPLGKNRSG